MNIEILLLVFVALSGVSAASTFRSRRCVVDGSAATRIALSSTCDSCSPSTIKLPDVDNTGQIMVVIASGNPTKSPLLTIASQLIAARLRVVLVRMYDASRKDDTNLEIILEKEIRSSVPCDMDAIASTLLSFQRAPVDGTNGDCSDVAQDSPYDALAGAESEYHVLRTLLESGDLPNAMVLDAANVGGQLVAENLGIPSVLLAPHSMLNLVADKTAPSTGLFDLFQRRKDSFMLAKRFMQMNKIRKPFGLPLLRNPSDYFETSTVVLINELAVPSAQSILPLHAHFVSPLLPPCIPCHDTDNGMATIIVMATGLTMADSRTLIRGLSMARDDFQSFIDSTCHPDNPGSDIHPEMCAFAEKMANFKVTWQIQNGTVLPELPPLFVSEDSSPVLELLSSYYSSTVAVISHCDSESYPVFALGQRLVCIPTSNGEIDSPWLGELSGGGEALLQSTAIASRLVNLLIDMHDETVTGKESPQMKKENWHTLVDGGKLTAQIIETIATSSRNETTDRLRELVNDRVGRQSKTKVDLVSLLVASSAWNVMFMISLGYCLRLIYVTTDSGITPTTKRLLRSPPAQVVFQYLEELDWALLFAEKFWWSDDASIHNRIDRFLRRYEPEEEVVGAAAEANQQPPEPTRETPGHNARRRRHARKR